jgi:hypothetical protein
MHKRFDGIYSFVGNAYFVIHMQVIELNPSSYIGHQLKYEAFHGARRYDEAIEAFKVMLSKLDNAPETQIRSKPRLPYASIA